MLPLPPLPPVAEVSAPMAPPPAQALETPVGAEGESGAEGAEEEEAAPETAVTSAIEEAPEVTAAEAVTLEAKAEVAMPEPETAEPEAAVRDAEPAPAESEATLPEPEPAPALGPAPTAPPAPAVAGDRVGVLLGALADPAALEIQIEAGRTPLVRTEQGWAPVGDGPLSSAEWSGFWGGFCDRSGTDRGAGGYVARLVDGVVSAEAILPPVAAEPTFTSRRLPPQGRLEDFLSGAEVEMVRNALGAQRGVLVLGDPRSGLTSVLEAIVDAIPPGGRVALVELRPQIRHSAASVLRLRSQQGQGAAAVDLAMTTSPDWVVIDEGLPEAAGTAAWRHGAGGPTPVVAGRAPNPAAWRERALGATAALAGSTDAGREALDGTFAVIVTVTPAAGGGFSATVTRS